MTTTTTMLTLVLEELEQAARDEGHIFLERTELHARIAARVDAALRIAAREQMVVIRGSVHVAELPDERIYLTRLDKAEQGVADGVVRLLRRPT